MSTPTGTDRTAAWRPSACILCECNCGIVVQTEDRAITKIRGDKDHPASQGYTCNKALRLDHYQSNANRLTAPLRRRPDGSYERLTPPPNTVGISAQDWLLQNWKTRSEALASQAQTRASRGEQVASGFLPVPETDMTATLAPSMHSINGDSV